MVRGNHGHVFLPGSVAGGRCGRPCPKRSKARALHPGVHVGFIVVANIEHIVAPFEHTADALKTYVRRAAVSSLGDDVHRPLSQRFIGSFNPGGHCRCIFKKAVQKGNAPGRIRIG